MNRFSIRKHLGILFIVISCLWYHDTMIIQTTCAKFSTIFFFLQWVSFLSSSLLIGQDNSAYLLIPHAVSLSIRPLYAVDSIFDTDELLTRLRKSSEQAPKEQSFASMCAHEQKNIAPLSDSTPNLTCSASKTKNKATRCSCFCGQIFNSADKLNNHIELHKKEDNLFYCNLCSNKFFCYEHLAIHYANRHAVNYKAASLALMPILNEKKRKGPFICCENEYESFKDLRSHVKKCHVFGVGYQCPNKECKTYMSDVYALVDHYVSHLKPDLLRCVLCTSSLSSIAHLIRHYHEVDHDNQDNT